MTLTPGYDPLVSILGNLHCAMMPGRAGPLPRERVASEASRVRGGRSGARMEVERADRATCNTESWVAFALDPRRPHPAFGHPLPRERAHPPRVSVIAPDRSIVDVLRECR